MQSNNSESLMYRKPTLSNKTDEVGELARPKKLLEHSE